jgi:hypothetical protein
LRVPRVKCKDCGIHIIKYPWARHKTTFTTLLEQEILDLAIDMPVVIIAERLKEHDTKIWRTIFFS